MGPWEGDDFLSECCLALLFFGIRRKKWPENGSWRQHWAEFNLNPSKKTVSGTPRNNFAILFLFGRDLYYILFWRYITGV
jgi:hypothetical protein